MPNLLKIFISSNLKVIQLKILSSFLFLKKSSGGDVDNVNALVCYAVILMLGVFIKSSFLLLISIEMFIFA